MKNIKRIASLLLMFSLVLIPICEVDAAQPPLVFDFESEIIGDDIFDGVDKTNNVKIENGFYNMGGLFLLLPAVNFRLQLP